MTITGKIDNPEDAVRMICRLLDQGNGLLGFVSPSHQVPQMLQVIELVRRTGRTPVIVYNSNGYDKAETIRQLEGIVDVYLPDLKYVNAGLGRQYSGVPEYFEVASRALTEMYRQKGSSVRLNNSGVVESGLIIRHLVLPASIDDSIAVLEWVAENLSERVYISLMSQYTPTTQVRKHQILSRPLQEMEYRQVLNTLERLEFERGWVQGFGSIGHYLPDFSNAEPFTD